MLLPMAGNVLLTPTKDEARNGWTAEKLTAYHADRERAQAERIGIGSPQYHAWGTKPAGMRNRPSRAMSDYDPTRW